MALCASALAVALSALAVDVQVQVRSFVSTPIANRVVNVQLMQAQLGAVTVGPWVVPGDSVSIYSDTNGVAWFSNMLTLGNYRLTVQGNPGSVVPFSVTYTNGAVNVVQLIGTNVTPRVFYTADQIDALFGGLARSNWVGSFFGNGAGISNVSMVNLIAGTGITITQSGPGLTNVVSLYFPPTVASFTNNIGTVENGTIVTSTVLGWSTTGATVAYESLDNGIGSLSPPSLLTFTHSSSYSANRTYTLLVTDLRTTNTATTTILFSDKAYWGANAATSLTDPQIIALSSEFASSRLRTKTVTAAAQYLYFAYPAAFGAASFVVNGLPDTDWTLVTRNFVNASGYTASFNIYRSNNLLTGTYIVTVQ